MTIKKSVEYFVHYKDGDVDSVDWRTAKKLVQKPSENIDYIERCVRYWDVEDESLVNEKCETLWSSE
jgi:hypothetical protein